MVTRFNNSENDTAESRYAWQYWTTATQTASTNSIATMAENYIWPLWNDATSSGATTTIWDSVWDSWSVNVKQPKSFKPKKLTPEQIEKARKAQEEQDRKAQERREREAKERKERERLAELARERAMALLLEMLHRSQVKELRNRGSFITMSNKGTLYEVAFGRQHNVFELDNKQRRIAEYCITNGGPEWIPDADVMLAQKLMIETDEDSLRRIANIRRYSRPQDRPNVLQVRGPLPNFRVEEIDPAVRNAEHPAREAVRQ